MKAIVVERGDRPDLQTKSRVIAPQAAKYLADKFESMTFADSASIVLDWVGDLNWSGDGAMPVELLLPVMMVVCEKKYPAYGGRTLRVDYVLEMEDFFGHDNATKDDLDEIINNLEQRIHQEEKLKGL